MLLFLPVLAALHARLVTGQTPAPTVPTPFPTITPAPESECLYADTENGPFALDCLQAQFITAGCSMRGTSYPTEVLEDNDGDANEGDKSFYNAMTWGEVKSTMAAIQVTGGAPCRGPITPMPTDEPTQSPVTRSPTSPPTKIPTSLTPAPVYPEDYGFVELIDSTTFPAEQNTPALSAAAILEACQAAGFDRQYDATQYVVKITMGETATFAGFTDYYTFVPVMSTDGDGNDTGKYDSVCQMLEDPEGSTTLWSSSPDGPFLEVDLASDSAKTPDNRRYSSWLDTRGDNSGLGYGTDNPSDLTAVGSMNYKLSISSKRSFSKCVERVSPVDYEPICTRTGSGDQDWSLDSKECGKEAAESTSLHYAMANGMFSTCDDFCVYHPDYLATMDGTADESSPHNTFWFWTSGTSGGCWKPRSGYGNGEFQNCNPNEENHLYPTVHAFAMLRQATLCTEPCDYENGWTYSLGSCYKVVDASAYDTDGNAASVQANNFCAVESGTLASITSKEENDFAVSMCGDLCYIGNDPAAKGTAAGGWLDGAKMIYSNWNGGYEGSSFTDGDYLELQTDGTWKYTDGTANVKALCEVAADEDLDASGKNMADYCMAGGADSDHMATNQTPLLDINSSGFVNAAAPGELSLMVTVPKYFYNVHITFENSTNDYAEYNWEYGNAAWVVTDDAMPTSAADCATPVAFTGAIDWTVFNLGGAGGVQRLATWQSDLSTTVDPDTALDSDGWENSQYLFGSVMRIEATQPVFTSVNVDADTFAQREATFTRTVVARIPFILQFQKTVTVTTDVDIISTKFNYKTVAAIIQSIQYDTQYFTPPYASIKMQIRTKSQYPYLLNIDTNTITLLPEPVSGGLNDGESNVEMSIVHLHDDVNCTFTNPDHTREGDICTQEWMVTLIPSANVCYATGEYSIVYTAGCFYTKDVCYLPRDSNGEEITTVTFTFKVQTSKFCPTVADEVDLRGELAVTGRESFKPTNEGVEGNTEGSFYLQGEVIHLLAQTASEKAVITATRVVMVELVQDLSQLVMTGYNRVPYDPTSTDLTVWTKAGSGRIADGSVSIDDGNTQQTLVLMTDGDVYNSGSIFADGQGNELYNFEATEAGFKILLHAKAFPVNVDSFGDKTLAATLEVDYENVATGVSRRRLLQAERTADMRSRTSFQLNAWQPSITVTDGEVASMSMDLTIQQSAVSRRNVRGFVQSFEDAILTALKYEAVDHVYDGQVAVDAVWSKETMIWSRPTAGEFNMRKLLQDGGANQKLRVEFTIVSAPMADSVSVSQMLTIFDKQLRSLSSPLMQQPIFAGSVVHECRSIEASSYRMPRNQGTVSVGETEVVDFGDESSAVRSLPAALLALAAVALLW